MPLRQGARRGCRPYVPSGLVLYAFVVIGTAFEHHDLACHQKSPTHCTACVANPMASRVETSGMPESAQQPAVGPLETPAVSALETLLPARRAGRSPPTPIRHDLRFV